MTGPDRPLKPTDPTGPVGCDLCAVAAPHPPTPDWTVQRGNDGELAYLCPGCTRVHIRSIEARIAPQWW